MIFGTVAEDAEVSCVVDNVESNPNRRGAKYFAFSMVLR